MRMFTRRGHLALVSAATGALFSSSLALPATSAEQPTTSTSYVVPINWDAFDRGLPTEDAAELSRSILLNANKFALMSWYDERGFADQDGQPYLDLGGTTEHFVRPVGSMAQALATSLSAGAYDEEVVGFPQQEAQDTAIRLATSVAYRHFANEPGGWGNAWQSALWASSAGFAGWMLWDELSAADQILVERMVVHEADRFLDYEVPYYRDADGELVYPGDTKAEENAWNAFHLTLAAAMMPDHPNWAVWQDKAIELMISSYSREADLDNDTELHGKPVSEWLNGSNIYDDGTLVNHSIIHPDYQASITNSTSAPLVYSLAGERTPVSALFNADIVYQAMVDLEFESPPFDPPGGTIYMRDQDGHPTADAYYPEGTSWGTSRQMHFVLVDTQADQFGFDTGVSIAAADWAHVHASRAFEMQERHDDGRTYGPDDDDPFQSREEWVARQAARAYQTHWLVHQDAVMFTNRAYPVTPADHPGATLELETATRYEPDEATPVSIHLHSESAAPLVRAALSVTVPDGWDVVLADGSADRGRVPPGATATTTWLVTPPADAEFGPAPITATATYQHYGRDRTLEASRQVLVPRPGNVALGRPTEVSSARSPSNGGDKAVDGSFTDEDRWMSSTNDPEPWIIIDLEQPYDLDSIHVFSGTQEQNHPSWSTLKDFVVEVHTENGWVQVADIVDNDDHEVAVTGLDIAGDLVRLDISRPSASTTDIARVFQIEVYEVQR
jgi:hypothetical protein